MNMFAFAVKVILVLVMVFFVEFYFTKKITWAVKIFSPNLSAKKIKLWKRTGLVFLNLFPLSVIVLMAYFYFTGNYEFSLPENTFYDYFVLYPFWFGTIIIVQTILLFIPFDIIRKIFFRIFSKTVAKKTEAKLFLIIFFLSSIYVPARIIYDYNSVDVRYVNFQKPDLPQSLNGLRIALISDLQADRYTNYNRLENFIQKVNKEKPDLILIAGDIITHSPKYINLAAEEIGKLKANHGVYSCIGDHDNWAYRTDNKRSVKEITDALAKVGVPMINNKNLYLQVDTAKIKISFITNTYVEKVKKEILDSLTSDKAKSDLKIFHTHQPREHLIKSAVNGNYDLYFCGHTHGGQITFLFPFYNLSPTMAETFYLKGDFHFKKKNNQKDLLMIVTRGLGMSLAPIRYNSTPEIVMVVLNTHR